MHPLARLVAIERRLEAGDEVTHHRVVLRQLAQGLLELGVRRGDGGEEVPVLPFVMAGQGGAEAPAPDHQVAGRRGIGAPVDRGPHEVQGLPQTGVDRPHLVCPGDEPGVLALSHGRAKGGKRATRVLLAVRRLHA